MRIRQERLNTIRSIVATREVSTQEELHAQLKQLGYDVTQPTISRDMSELGLRKMRRGDGEIVYKLPEIEHLQTLLHNFLVGVDRAENLVVVKTSPGAAQGVGAAVDKVGWQEIVGTVAGDDTILVIVKSASASSSVARRLQELGMGG